MRFRACLCTLLLAMALPAIAKADPIADAAAAVRDRLVETRGPEGVVDMAPGTVETALTDAERQLFGETYLRFTVDRPVTVSVYRDTRLDRVDEPFWLLDGGFVKTEFSAEAYSRTFDVWQRAFPAGEIGLGVHAFRVVREHYFVSVAARDNGEAPVVTLLTPEVSSLGRVELGALTYIDRSVTLDAVSDELLGQVLVRTPSDRRPAASIYDYFRLTDHPATAEPDQILLTLTEDPSTAMAVQWRTATSIDAGAVALWRAADFHRPVRPEPTVVQATTVEAKSERTVNQPSVHRHSAVLRDLEPDTAYVYAVGRGNGDWSSIAEFRTAPAGDAAFSFLYFGDVQEGFDRFDSVLDQALRVRPDARFAIFAGDLVSRGTDADNWDDFFAVASPALRHIPVVPALGNHELEPAESADYYRNLFTLPENGPETIDPERAYHVTYGGVDLIVLDSNLDGKSQRDWLDAKLGDANDAFTVVVSHHAAYTSRPGRYYARVSEDWAPLIERSGKVSFVFQGHDHAYLRTPRMLDGRPDDGNTGPYYVISSAGEKFYDQHPHPYIEVGLTETQLFQVIDVMRDDDRLVYRAFDVDGDERDRIVIEP